MEIKKTEKNSIVRFETELASEKLIIETGHLAGQADGSCTIQMGDTVVLATTVMAAEQREGVDFFPLTVDYEERLYAAGKIKGSRWIKREGRPSDESILTSRLVDRSIRPLFPDALKNDVQVIVTVLSFDGENDPDIVSLLAVSTALSISKIPWNGPIGGVRLGYIPASDAGGKGEWVINPHAEARNKSAVDLIVAGTKDKIIMLEAGAKELPESIMYAGAEFSLKYIGQAVEIINEVTRAVGKKKISPEPTAVEITPEEAKEWQAAEAKAIDWIKINVPKELFAETLITKTSRKTVVASLQEKLMEYLIKENIGKEKRKKAENIFAEQVELLISQTIIEQGKRVDGRKLEEIRPLNVEVGFLPRTHGSAIFARGETQVMSVVTLGAPGDEQLLEGLEETGKKRYMHHYNFPPFSVGEVGRIGSPGRREIGHGALAERALQPVLPSKEEFPYTVRVVSEVLSSNGSSSMASTCGSSLALMDAGVPIKRPVAGIAMGLASDSKGNYKVLTDLQDLEDGYGGMDFKVAGTVAGITAIQMDTKTDGLTLKIVKETLDRAFTARLEILKAMGNVIEAPRPNLSTYAPRIITIKINPDKIRDVIGPGGKIINEIIDKTGVQIDIEPDGTVLITAVNEDAGKKAVEWVHNLTREIRTGEIFEGPVVKILDFGAFVQLTPNQDGMVHISELASYRVGTVNDVVKIGQVVKCKVINVDDQGRINLSMKALLPGGDKFADDQGQGGYNRRPRFNDNHRRNSRG